MRKNWFLRALWVLLAPLSCDGVKSTPTAKELFETELRNRGIPFSAQDEEGVYTVVVAEGGESTVALENIARDYERSGDPAIITRFVDNVLGMYQWEVPPWETAQGLVYLAAEHPDHDFGDTIYSKLTDGACKVLVLMDPEKGRVLWLTPQNLEEWNISEEKVSAAALKNLARLLDGKRLEVKEIHGMKLGMIPVESVAFKASTIFAPNFKQFVSDELEWPVLAVIPCRDFIYVISEKDQALLNSMGGVVQREYRESGYPITREVLRISDKGIEAIGRFPE